jgi:hypothetical protein
VRVTGIFPEVPWRTPQLNGAEFELLLVPDQAWEVLDGEAVAISLNMKGVIDPDL